jgi:signal transduction histidine kinase/CheY-like chemotaxis protein
MSFLSHDSPWPVFIEWWVPSQVRGNRDSLQRARFVVSAWLLQIAISTISALVWAFGRGLIYAAFFVAANTLWITSLFAYRKTARSDVLAHAGAAVTLSLVIALAFYWGAPSALSLTALSLVPAGLQLLAGARESTTWFLITTVFMFGYHVLRVMGCIRAEMYIPPVGVQATFPMAFNATLFCFAMTYDRWRTRVIEELGAANRELVVLREKADGAARAKSEFLATVSHEVRTPMNGVLGMVSLLRETNLDGEQRRYVEVLQQSGEVLMRILNDVLDYEKYEAGRLNLCDEDFSPRVLAEAVAALLTPRANEAGVSLVLAVHSSVPDRARGDGGRVRQVLLNLVSNAVKFTRNGAVRIDVRSEDERLWFSVTDTGIGIAPSLAEKLFEPFTQGDAHPSGRCGSTGLGLAICRRLVKAMEGDIGFESQMGEGSHFWFWVPLRVARRSRPSVERISVPKVAAGVRVLLVEDNPVNELVARRFLAQHDVECTVARDGIEALSHLETARFDVVFMDCHMPIMDGFEATRRLRIMERERGAKRTPVVAMTAGVLESDRHACVEAGMDDFVSKPLRPEQVRALLRRFGSGERKAA